MDEENMGDSSPPVNSNSSMEQKGSSNGWSAVFGLYRKHHRLIADDINEDIDTLLVFAGLFSAVLTTFVVDSYKTLKSQPEDGTSQALYQISAQLASFVVSANFANSSAAQFDNSTLTSSPSAILPVVINTLWSASLTLSLITASFGILIKQSLHKLSRMEGKNPHELVNILTSRDKGFRKWFIVPISAALPHLLQFALILFFIGLSLSLHELNAIVGWTTTGITIVWILCLLLVNLAAPFVEFFPYVTLVDLLWKAESAVRKRVREDFQSAISILMYAQDVILQGESLGSNLIVECLQGYKVGTQLNIQKHIASIAGDIPSETISRSPLPTLEGNYSTALSEAFLILMQETSHVKDVFYIDSGELVDVDFNDVERPLLMPGQLYEWSDLYWSLVITVKAACDGNLACGDKPLHLTHLALLRHGENSATLAMLSYYVVLLDLVTGPGKLVWWVDLEMGNNSKNISVYFLAKNLRYATRNVLNLIWASTTDSTLEGLTPDPIVLLSVFAHFSWLAMTATRNSRISPGSSEDGELPDEYKDEDEDYLAAEIALMMQEIMDTLQSYYVRDLIEGSPRRFVPDLLRFDSQRDVKLDYLFDTFNILDSNGIWNKDIEELIEELGLDWVVWESSRSGKNHNSERQESMPDDLLDRPVISENAPDSPIPNSNNNLLLPTNERSRTRSIRAGTPLPILEMDNNNLRTPGRLPTANGSVTNTSRRQVIRRPRSSSWSAGTRRRENDIL